MESQLKEKNALIKKLQTDAQISKENQEKENKKFIDCEYLNDVVFKIGSALLNLENMNKLTLKTF